MLKVCKFGGSSVANSTQLKKIKSIIESDDSRKIVVVSAPGKDEANQSKITDLLFLLHAHLEYGVPYTYLIESVEERFNTICNELGMPNLLNEEFDHIKSQLKKGISKDYLVSRGEYLTAKIVSEYLGYTFVDSLDGIFMKHDGTIDYEVTKLSMTKYFNKHDKIVVPGFYAGTPEKMVRLFGRGGSDLTGSILARVLDVDIYENWTDVSGIYVADPRIIDTPKSIKKITYNELRELTFRGARVLQQEAVIPLEEIDVPIQIKNTNMPKDYGTLITNSVKENGDIITGMSGLKEFTSINITKQSDISMTVVLKEVLNTFIRYKIELEHIPTGIDTLSIITKTSPLKKVYFEFMHDLREIKGVVLVEEEDDISLLAIVGRNMARIPGVAGRIFSTLGKENINIKVIAQASKEISIIIGVSSQDYERAVKIIYNEFYN